MCELLNHEKEEKNLRKIPVAEAIGTVLAHDVTEIRKGEFKGRAFKKGHVITPEDVCHLQRLGKEHLFVLELGEGEIHEDDAAFALASALMGEGVSIQGEPKEGKINIIADRDGLLKIDTDGLLQFNMLPDIMCATLHDNTVVRKDRVVAGTRAIPLVMREEVLHEARKIGEAARESKAAAGRTGIVEVKAMRRPKAGVVITGNEVYSGRIRDSFASIIQEKIQVFDGDIAGIVQAPDDERLIEAGLRELLDRGADLLITTGGMSVDPDDVTRFAIRRLGTIHMTYGSAVLPGAMFLVAYLPAPDRQFPIPVLGIPACAMYHKITVLDLVLPRVLAGEIIGRKDLAELGHGGLCLNCKECRFPVCPFGK